jgi:hypothetical protein
MRQIILGAALIGLALPAAAQTAAPLPAYVPPPSAAPLAPLPGDSGSTPPDPPLGDVRASSTTASNIGAADTRSPIAPVLPTPDVAGNSPRDFLVAARSAILAGQTGAAQEALERAETRQLSRDVAPSDASNPIEGPMIRQIGVARQALSVGNSQAALQAIAVALQS